MIAIVDYDAGNIRSVENAMKVLGEEAVLTGDPNVIAGADRVILPGVGAFGDAMERIRARGLEGVLQEVCRRGTPFLGICLGLQLLFEESEESPGVRGLSILPGKIVRFPGEMPEPAISAGFAMPDEKCPQTGADNFMDQAGGGAASPAGRFLKVPEIGWNDLTYPVNSNPRRLFRDIPEHSHVYFVHSYYLQADDPAIVKATTEYSTTIHASVQEGYVCASQFHPEKSGALGLRILTNFLKI